MTETREQVLAKQERAAALWRERQRARSAEASRAELAEAARVYNERYPQRIVKHRKPKEIAPPVIVEEDDIDDDHEHEPQAEQEKHAPPSRLERDLLVLGLLWIILLIMWINLRVQGIIPVQQ